MRTMLKPAEIQVGDLLVVEGRTVSEVRYTNSLGTAFSFTTGLSLLLARDIEYEIERPVAPAAVVIDTYWGYTFSNDEDPAPFTVERARAFAARRNDGLKVPTYRVYRLTEDA